MLQTNIYETEPQTIESRRVIGGYVTVIHLNIREAENVGELLDGEEAMQQWESEDIVISHKQPLTSDDRDTLISKIIRAKYSSDKMEAIVNNYLLTKTAENKAEFKEMQEWRSYAKELASQIISNG